ncbi:C39 family peptidase [Methanoregula sp.]|uniref:C39 family peptidase n=1 Tax=Methanoregula sp. TaxID=2052170 RepID=UPI003563E9C2
MRRLYVVLTICLVIPVMALALSMVFSHVTPLQNPSGIRYGLDTSFPEPGYYTGIDFDTLKSNDHLTVIPLKSYRQQMTNYSCGAVAAMTVMSYYGKPLPNADAEEERVAREMNPSVSTETGINPEQVTTWFNRNGWNATWGTNGTGVMLRENLKNGIPTMVEWIDWGGHWVVVVGYDTRGTESGWDDVIIFADSVDSHDDRVDGITYFNYGEFDAMWFDAHYFPENMKNRAWVVAVPNTTSP